MFVTNFSGFPPAVLRGGSRKDISDQIGPFFDVCHAQCILTRHCTILSLEEASLAVIMN